MESEDSKPIKIIIIDAISHKIVTSGPLSSIKIEILALDGDFGTDDQEDWSEHDFGLNVVRQREGKRPLVIGDLETTLKDGVGYVGDVSFTDNSSWIRSRKFRLGARNVSTSTEVRIREARSEAFVVKDHRGECKSVHTLCLYLFVSRLCSRYLSLRNAPCKAQFCSKTTSTM